MIGTTRGCRREIGRAPGLQPSNPPRSCNHLPMNPVETASPVADDGFATLGLDARLLKTVAELGYEEPTPIQREAIPPLLEGRDLLARGADRHRQDRGVRAADPPAPRAARGEPAARPRAARPRPRPASSRCRSPRRSTATGAARRAASLPVYGGQPIGQQLRGARSAASTSSSRRPAARSTTSTAATLRFDAVADRRPRRGRRDARHGLRRGPRGDPRGAPGERQTALFSATMPPRIARSPSAT